MSGLYNGNVSTIIASLLKLAIDTTVQVLRDIDGQIELHIGEPSIPCGNSWVALADFYDLKLACMLNETSKVIQELPSPPQKTVSSPLSFCAAA